MARRSVCQRTAAVLLAMLSGVFMAHWLGLAIALGVVVGLWVLAALFNRYFFRDPNPRVPSDAGLLLAPAHGRVDCLEKSHEPEFMQGPAWRISIFLSVLDVHVQNAPVAGRIALVRHQPGQFLNALQAQSAQHNENVLIGIESCETPGDRVAIRQVAGAIARRIESWVTVGDTVARGQRLGMIRFGSRCGLYLPLEARVLIRPGTKVRGGETIVARCEFTPEMLSLSGDTKKSLYE